VLSFRQTLSITFTGDEPPTEFCIFTAGEIETTKGVFTFDADSATSVMAEYAKHGIDLMIDYDHASLASVSLDPAQAGKAAGWFNLEVRNGELWAVNVRWTPPAADALRRKEWRFMSPAFGTLDGRITDLLNVAITNLPATRNLTPLMAASMKPENVMAALEALIAGDSEKCAELLKGIIAEAAGAAAPAPPAEEPPPADEAAAVDPAAPPAEEDEEKKEEMVAASALLRLTGAANLASAVVLATEYRASHIALEAERQKLAQERAVLESAERRKGCIDLVKAGRAPSTVWADDKCSGPKKYLAAMSIEDFRDFVADAISGGPRQAPRPPVAASGVGSNGLTAEQVRMCAETGCDPATFAMLKARTTAK
jgi:phage I-like protein